MRIVRCERCGWIGRETEITIPDHCPGCEEYGGLKLCDSEQEYSIDELRFLWEQFDDITKVPRPSKKEGKITEWLVAFAQKHGFDYQTDETGNVVMRKPATKGFENRPLLY